MPNTTNFTALALAGTLVVGGIYTSTGLNTTGDVNVAGDITIPGIFSGGTLFVSTGGYIGDLDGETCAKHQANDVSVWFGYGAPCP